MSILLASFAISGVALGQANFLSIFGANSGSSPGIAPTCNPTNLFNCTMQPSIASCYHEPTVNDLLGEPAYPLFQNAVYSNIGTLLFTVTNDGIYGGDAGGTQIYSFDSNAYYGAGAGPYFGGVPNHLQLHPLILYPTPCIRLRDICMSG